MGGVLDIGVKILVAALLGGLVGAEREHSGKWAGLRTHMLISVGAALLTHLSVHIGALYTGELARWDPGRIAAQIVTGVGFLGAGTIIQSRGHVRGLTTAAGLWVAAAVGMAVGSRFYVEAVVTTLVLLLVLAALPPVERLLRGKVQDVMVELPAGHSLAQVAAVLDDLGLEAHTLRVHDSGGHRSVHIRFHSGKSRRQELVAALTDAGLELSGDD